MSDHFGDDSLLGITFVGDGAPQQKTLSAFNENLGGALVPPQQRGRSMPVRRNKFRPIIQRKAMTTPLPCRNFKSMWATKASTHAVGVPWQTASGIWYVRRASDGRTVRTTAPGGATPAASGPATPPSASAPAAPATPVASSAAPVGAAGSLAGFSFPPFPPNMSDSYKARKDVNRRTALKILNKVLAGQALTPQELSRANTVFINLLPGDLLALQQQLQGSASATHNARADALVVFATAGTQAPSPAVAPVAAPAPLAPSAPTAPLALPSNLSSPDATAATPTAAASAPAKSPHGPDVPYSPEINWETGKASPGVLNGVPFASAPPKFWEKVKDVNVNEPPPLRKVDRVGVMIQEPDGRIWIVQPTNEYGDRKYTLPGGGVEQGLTDQQNALKEVWEESGLQVEITGYMGDFEDSNTKKNGRLYVGKRVGGAPWDAKQEPHITPSRKTGTTAESEGVTLVTPEKASQLLHRTDDLAQLMTVHPIKIDHPVKGKGSEPLKKFLSGIAPTIAQYKQKKQQAGHAPGCSELHGVQNLRGFNKKPTTLDKGGMDALVAKGGHIELLRGVKGNSGVTADDMANQFRDGDNFPGYGVFGAGTYADAKKGDNNAATGSYSRNYGSGGGAVIRMAMPKTAKIVKISDLENMVPAPPDAFTDSGGNGSTTSNWWGIQAALAGYDAIHVDGNSPSQGTYGSLKSPHDPHDFYVVLNRSILTVQKEDAKGHVIK